MDELPGSFDTEQQRGGGGTPPIMVEAADDLIDTPEKLILALNDPSPRATIRLENKEYKVDTPLFVPNGVTLQGAGMMKFNSEGLPDGFQGTPTTITANAPNFPGNLLTLGNQSSVRRVRLNGANQVGFDGDGRGGNVVAVASPGNDKTVSAAIAECELMNQIPSAGGRDGPTGGAILAYTRNPEGGTAPHENAVVTLRVTESILRTPPAGKAVFAMNFASRGKVTVNLTKNVVGGPLDVVGGLARPDEVRDARTTINSDGNLYKQQSGAVAWQIFGGSTPPIPAGSNSKADSNTAGVDSKNDRIENFEKGIVAVGGRRLSSDHGNCSNNKVNLTLTGMKIAANPASAAADFTFAGALGPFPAGENNAVVVEVLAGITSDRLFYIDVRDVGVGTGNQLAFKGTLAAFTT
jgi:hypothetical protein